LALSIELDSPRLVERRTFRLPDLVISTPHLPNPSPSLSSFFSSFSDTLRSRDSRCGPSGFWRSVSLRSLSSISFSLFFFRRASSFSFSVTRGNPPPSVFLEILTLWGLRKPFPSSIPLPFPFFLTPRNPAKERECNRARFKRPFDVTTFLFILPPSSQAFSSSFGSFFTVEAFRCQEFYV